MKSSANNLAVSSETKLSVIAPVGVANVIWVLNTADASVASLNLNHLVKVALED